MIAAAHLDNFLFLLFIAVAVFFQLLTRAANKGRRSGGGDNRRSTPAPPTPRSAREQPQESDEEERIRKFLEALGQPTSSKPPPPVVRRPTYQKPIVMPKRIFRDPTGLPPLTTRPPDLPPEIQIPESVAPITQPEVTAAFQPPTQPVSKPEAQSNLATRLRTSAGLREAIILREIFGPPRSMQPLDLIGNV